MTNEQPLVPPVIWAQRNTVVYITICLEDCKNPDINIEPEQVYFRGVGGPEKKVYEVTIPLFAKVEPENCKTIVGGRYIELVLLKPSEDTKYWPHLTKEKKKYHWLKVDFKKWKDEDETDDEAAGGGDGNIDDMLSMMGGAGKMGGMGGMGGLGGLGGDFNEPSDEDSDDEEMPDLDDIETEAGKGKEKNEEDLPKLEEVKPATTA
ncbi:co-chaperone protein daf-41 [Daktulosphaira vitifoliae]|uniref:co-chaperone protein daf-41 n=1 Tax=Daktulosphaira vitifoliae TaxID=58002 RepID=UPI0021A9EBB6|nr:co-chaperone protein daf-41 [Daktulosphaira vitifoliae]